MLRRLLIAAGGGTIDPHWTNVLYLLRFNGNAADIKGRPFVLRGAPAFVAGRFGQAISPVGTSSESGATDSTAGVADYAFGTGDFTIEGWTRQAPGSGGGTLISFFDTGGPNGWQIYFSAGEPQFYQYVQPVNGAYPIRATGTDLRDNLWHHLAVTRASGVLRMFVDGVEVGSVANTVNFGYAGLYVSIGYQRQGNARYTFQGAIDEVRVTKGVARYTAAFTPPTEEFPAG